MALRIESATLPASKFYPRDSASMKTTKACQAVKSPARNALRFRFAVGAVNLLSKRRDVSVEFRRCKVTRAVQSAEAPTEKKSKSKKPLKVLVAGGGIGGLSAALALQNKGFDVQVFERVKKYKPFGGPIQLQCNSMGTLQAIDAAVGEEVLSSSTITGDRINGLMDGVHGGWFFRFDTRKPCFNNGLPLTLVIHRARLLDILLKAVGEENVTAATEVESYVEDKDGVTCKLSNGETARGDILIGADGIRSKVRQQMRGEETPLCYSQYTVYTGTCDFTNELTDVNQVGYQVFLGPDLYFVASDVGDNTQQWYAFHREQPGGVDDKCMKEQLLEYFKDWTPVMKERLECTKAEVIERRDVYDLAPTVSPWGWSRGRVTLLGDAIHAVQPNLGQGGGQAIESAYTLADELDKWAQGERPNVQTALQMYAGRRILRAGSIHGLSRMAALMNIVYRPFLGSNPYDFYPEPVKEFWRQVEKLRIPHPGRVIGQIAMMTSMQYILEYVGSGFGTPQVLGGTPVTVANRRGERPLACQVPGISSPKRPLTDDDFKMKGVPGLAK